MERKAYGEGRMSGFDKLYSHLHHHLLYDHFPAKQVGFQIGRFLWSGNEEARELSLLLPKQFGGY